MEQELRQSEIITNLSQFTYAPVSGVALETRHAYAIVMSQDCDLLRDYKAQAGGGRRVLNGVLLYELQRELEIRDTPGINARVWRQIRQNREERFHVLPPVPQDFDLLGEGLPELVIDFRRCFTLPPDEIYRQCTLDGPSGAKRRCRLATPYREHLQCRAAFYFQRVALPDDAQNEAVAVVDREDGGG
jgi:hypothetical protein